MINMQGRSNSNLQKYFFLPFYISVYCLLFNACTKSNICLTPKVVALRGGFYWQDTAKVFKDSIQTNANLFFGNATTYFLNLKQRSKFSLSLAQDIDQVMVIYQADSAAADPAGIDSLQINYLREPHFISTACGYETFFNIQSVTYTQHVIDTVILSTAAINNDVNKEHLKIVIRK